MGADDDVDVELAQPSDQLEHLDASLGVEARSGLVQQEKIRIVNDRLGKFHSLLHTRGEVAKEAEPLFLQADQEQGLR